MSADPCPVALRGIVPSLNTPFTADDRIDHSSLRRAVDHLVDSGCAGVLALAVAGESAALSQAEYAAVAQTVTARAAGRIPVVLAITADDQATRLRRAELAKRLGARGVCVQAPTAAGRQALLAEIAAAGPDLLMLQDLDWRGGGLPLGEILQLFDAIPKFKSLKIETAPAGPKYSAALEATGGRLHVAGGWAVSQMLDALARGVHAFAPTAMEPIYVAIHRRWRRGDAAGARDLFERVLPVLAFANQHINVSIRFFKQMRRAAGLYASDRCRPPVAGFDAVQQAEADRLIARALKLERALSQAS